MREHSSPPTDGTRLAIIRAAEALFVERGFDAVSLREISAAAGQGNNSAVNYHFGSREGLVDAILERHSGPIQARYVAQIEILERMGTLTPRTLMEILALPIIAKLDDEDGGWAYLSLCAQLSVSPHMPLVSRRVAQTPEVLQLSKAMWSFVNAPPEVHLFRLERLATMIYVSVVQWHRLVSQGMAHVPREVFEQDLIDCLVDVLERPPSEATKKALVRANDKPRARAIPSPAAIHIANVSSSKKPSPSKHAGAPKRKTKSS